MIRTERLSLHLRIVCGLHHVGAAEVEIRAHELGAVMNRLRKETHGGRGVALLRCEDAAKIFNASVGGVLPGGLHKKSIRAAKIAALDMLLDCKQSRLIGRTILLGECKGYEEQQQQHVRGLEKLAR